MTQVDEAYMEGRVLEWRNKKGRKDLEEQWKLLRRGWYLGEESFLERLEHWLGKAVAGKRRESHSGGARESHDERAAERLLSKSMKVLGLKEADLKDLPLGSPEKVVLAWWQRKHTTVSLRWVAARLNMGHTHGSHKRSREWRASPESALLNSAGNWNESWKMDEKKAKCHNYNYTTDPFTSMKQSRLFIKGHWVEIALIMLMVFMGYELWRWFYGPRWFVNLESNAKKVVTADQLQIWATNLIELYGTNGNLSFTPRELGTNFPEQLLSLSPRNPVVHVFPPSDVGSPGSITIAWNAGATYGQRGFEIGPPDLIGILQANEWKPGVYFFRR